MEKIILSEKNDYWNFHTTPQGFCGGLQLNTGIIPGITLFDTVIDRDGNPHILLQNGRLLEYYYWTGMCWCAGKKPPVSIFSSFHLAQNNQGRLQLLLTSPAGNDTELSHYCLKEKGWQFVNTLVIPGDLKVEGFINWLNNDLVVIYSGSGPVLGLIIYSLGTWRIAAEIVGKGRVLDWYAEAERMYLLLGKESLPEGEVFIYTLSSKHPQDLVLVAGGEIQRWDGKPFLIPDKSGEFKICWQSRDRINIARLQGHSMQLVDHLENANFCPAEIRPLDITSHSSRLIALKTICGIKLQFPLILTAKDLEVVLKSQKLRGKGVSLFQMRKINRKEWKRDRPGLSGKIFSPFAHNDSQAWPEQK